LWTGHGEGNKNEALYSAVRRKGEGEERGFKISIWRNLLSHLPHIPLRKKEKKKKKGGQIRCVASSSPALPGKGEKKGRRPQETAGGVPHELHPTVSQKEKRNQTPFSWEGRRGEKKLTKLVYALFRV